MLTISKHRAHAALHPSTIKPRTGGQLRRDRWTAIVVLTLMIALVAFLLWLAGMSNGTIYEGIDYWPMML